MDNKKENTKENKKSCKGVVKIIIAVVLTAVITYFATINITLKSYLNSSNTAYLATKLSLIKNKLNKESIYDLNEEITLEKNIKDNIDVVVDRLIIKDGIRSRLYESLETSTKLSGGKVVISVVGGEEIIFSENFSCPHCNYSLRELEPRIFSFNAPYGACPYCKGLGFKQKMDVDLVIPDKTKSLNNGAILDATTNTARYSIQMKITYEK